MVEDIKESQEEEEPQLAEQHEAGTECSEGPQGEQDAGVSPEDREPVITELNVEALSQEVESLKQLVAENFDKAIRAQAEMENLRKRTTREIENAHKYGLDRFIKELLPVIDSMELGISASENAGDISSLKEGMDLTLKMFINVLNKSGIEVIDPQGDKFNPELHEAVSVQAVDDRESGTVIAVMQKGYTLNGRLVRPAMVVVAQ